LTASATLLEEADIELWSRPRAQPVAWIGEHEITARIKADRRLRLIEHDAELLLDLGGRRFEAGRWTERRRARTGD
jgi:hypothetical protein